MVGEGTAWTRPRGEDHQEGNSHHEQVFLAAPGAGVVLWAVGRHGSFALASASGGDASGSGGTAPGSSGGDARENERMKCSIPGVVRGSGIFGAVLGGKERSSEERGKMSISERWRGAGRESYRNSAGGVWGERGIGRYTAGGESRRGGGRCRWGMKKDLSF